MRERNKNAGEWGPRSATWRLAALAGAGLVVLGTNGLARPKAAAEVFGMQLQDPEDLPSWRPKAARDLTTGVITLPQPDNLERRVRSLRDARLVSEQGT